MAISRRRKLSINRSDDSSDYIAGFHRDALCLIIAGHEKLKGGDTNYSNEEEPNITGELVRCSNEYIDSITSHSWTRSYVVVEESPENTKERLGISRKKVDVVCIRTGRKPHLRIKFEAKRLKRPSFTVSIYIGKEGLGEFISGNYAQECDTAGMLGYIQSDDCDYWAEQIPNALNKKKTEVQLIEDDQWQNAGFESINHCYKTRHNRPTIKRELLVYHLLLDFIS